MTIINTSSPTTPCTQPLFKVLVMDGISSEGLAPLAKKENIEVTVITGARTEDEVCELVADKHALLVRSATKVTKKIFEAGKQLLIVGRAGVGIDNIDLESATKCGVFVVNSPLGNVVAAAEHTVALIFSTMRQIPAAHHSIVHLNKWDRASYVGCELKGRTLGVLGCGQVGSRVVRIMKAAGMNIVVYDPYMNDQRAEILGVDKLDTVEAVFEASDVITVHLPKTPETQNMVNKELLLKMKPGGVIVNVARGGIVVEEDLVALLKSDHIRAAALDVFCKEPLGPDSCLVTSYHELRGRLVLTPHLGASTEEAQLQVAVEVAEQCVEVFDGKVPSWAVNKCRSIQLNQGYELDELSHLTDACEFVGHMLEQLVGDNSIEQINVTVEGDLFLSMTTPQTLATYAAVGYLKSNLDSGRVNIVNVENICKDQCLELTSSSISHPKHSEFRVSCVTQKKQRMEIRATLSNRLPNDVIIRGFLGIPCHMKLSMFSGGRLLYSIHHDVKGVLAHLTTTMAQKDINIADCHLARLTAKEQKKVDHTSSPIKVPEGSHDIAIALILIDDADCSNDPAEAVKRGEFKDQLLLVGCLTLSN